MSADGTHMPMTRSAVATASSLVSIVLVTCHLADDVLFGMSPPGLQNLVGVLILVVWLYGTLALPDHRAGRVIVLLGSLFGLAVSTIHMTGSGGLIGGAIGKSSEAFFFVWTLLALGVSSLFAGVLAAQELWRWPHRS